MDTRFKHRCVPSKHDFFAKAIRVRCFPLCLVIASICLFLLVGLQNASPDEAHSKASEAPGQIEPTSQNDSNEHSLADHYGQMPENIARMENPIGHRDPSAIKTGRDLYIGLCIDCHGRSGDGQGAIAPYLDHTPVDFTDAEYMSRRTDQQLYWTIREGIPNAKMPAYGLLPEERWSLVAYLRYLATAE